jgi:glyoxylase-like metal-dependent hydrolase (beta-lactamase superfamily II)
MGPVLSIIKMIKYIYYWQIDILVEKGQTMTAQEPKTTIYMCVTCGTQFPPAARPPQSCPICEDERQYIGWKGQQWTTLQALQQDHHNVIRSVEPGLTGIGTSPSFSSGQRALLVQNPGGNVLWDCISLIDEATIAQVKALGGISAIAISHPHYYSSMIEWSRAFNAPIYLHAADREWVMRPDPAVIFWKGETQALAGGLTLVRCGGHFPGGTVLHWPAGAGGQGVLLTGDIINVVQDRRYVSFMYSFPNLIPLSPAAVRRVVAAVEPFAYDRIYSAWWEKVVSQDAKQSVHRSAERYIALIEQDEPVNHPVSVR